MKDAANAHANAAPRRLRRILGPVSVGCVGVGAAMGSGIFAAPGDAARHLHSSWLILAAWVAAGLITLLQALVTAELATRFPKAGGEYQFLKEAYGEFAAFFFGWSFTLFIVGGGTGTIAALFGDMTAKFFGLSGTFASPALGCAAIAVVVGVNALGLRTGAIMQNALTLLKTLALAGIAVGAMIVSGRWTPQIEAGSVAGEHEGIIQAFFLAMLPVFWSYTGATDSAKLAEETADVDRALPRALAGSALLLTAVYVVYNYALLCAATPTVLAGDRNAAGMIFTRAGVRYVDDLMLIVGALVCLGAISSTILANVRVMYAMARDGLAPRLFAGMSASQAPGATLLLAGALGCSFVVNRSFEQILRIYFMASTVLFGLTYLSLVVFRLRDRREPGAIGMHIFRLPCGPAIAIFLVALESALALNIVWSDAAAGTRDSLYTIVLLGVLATAYFGWKRIRRNPGSSGFPVGR